ncbi:autotransporter outer membrane beta-barrel domain-containing protein, partial [Escherichia coli]
GESVSAGYDQSGFRVGLGAELALNNKFGSYAGVQYARGQDYENPLQGVVGVTWYW